MKIATHSGRFHADDVFAVATLRLVGVLTGLVRTREDAVLAGCDIWVDVGRICDPDKGRFDHHQPGGAGKRPDGVPYASFGLVWRQYGTQAAGSPEAAAIVDAQLVRQIDADDTGYDIVQSQLPGFQPYTVSKIIGDFNPSWKADPTAADMDARFNEAVEFATLLLRREIDAANDQLEARVLIREVLKQTSDPRVIVLQRHTPWKQTIVTEAPQALYVVSPVWPAVRQQWSVEVVPKQLDSFEARKPLPEAWAGKLGRDLAVVSGVKDAVFCHTARFLAIAESRAGAVELARRACVA